MPVSKTKVVKQETIEEKPKEEEEQEFNDKVYDMISDVYHKMDLVLEKIEAISEKPKSRTSNLNTEATYTICKVLMARRLIQDDVTCLFLGALQGLHRPLCKYKA